MHLTMRLTETHVQGSQKIKCLDDLSFYSINWPQQNAKN
jgi:hypothetical protein